MMDTDRSTGDSVTSAAVPRKPPLVTVAAYLIWTQAAFGFVSLLGLLGIWDELPRWHGGPLSSIATAAIVGCGMLATVALGACAVMLLRRHRKAMWTAVIVELCLLLVSGYTWQAGSRVSPSLAVLVLLCLCQRSVRHWFSTPAED